MKVLFLNPPFEVTVQKDQYCSLTSKTGYIWTPVDLLLQTAVFRDHHEVLVIDAIVEKLSDEACLARVDAFRPDAIICLTSIITFSRDIELLKTYKQKYQCLNILMGDIVYFKPDTIIQSEWVDAGCLQFPTAGILDYLNGRENPTDMIVKKNGQVTKGVYQKGPVKIGIPQHTLFPLDQYRVPMMESKPIVPVITLLSCPMKCSYCPVSDVSYRPRDLDELFLEFDTLKALGVKEILMADLMFNADLARAKQICRKMIEENYQFSWYCLMRPDKADREIIDLAKRAGCHTILFGVETTSEELLLKNRRTMSLVKVQETFKNCFELGVKSMGIIILGLPGETKATAKATIDFICAQTCDFLSVNIFSPRLGSQYMPTFSKIEEILESQINLDSTRTEKSHCELSMRELKDLRSLALKKFYLDPKRIFRYAKKINTFFHLKQSVVNGIKLLVNY